MLQQQFVGHASRQVEVWTVRNLFGVYPALTKNEDQLQQSICEFYWSSAALAWRRHHLAPLQGRLLHLVK